MSRIPQLVALATLVYAIIILFVAFVMLPPFVAWSVWIYRLLLAAYPAHFRDEYGPAMVQVFRDTAREEYRRCGLRGLLMVWLRTLVDFGISVVRQHREQAAAAPASSESVLLHDLLRQWRQFGAVALSATTFSAWYGLHLLRLFFQRAVLVWAALTATTFGFWFWSFFDSITVVRERTSRIIMGKGIVWISHANVEGGPITEEQWHRDTQVWRKNNPILVDRLQSAHKPWEFSFISDIPRGVVLQYGSDRKTPTFIQPSREWQLLFPFFPLPLVLLLGTIRAYRRRRAVSGPAMQSA